MKSREFSGSDSRCNSYVREVWSAGERRTIMRDRFSQAISEMEEKSAFSCVTCDHHEIGGLQSDAVHGYDVNKVLEQIRRDPSPAGA